MSTTYVHPRARLGKPAAKAVRRNAPSTSGNGIPDPFGTLDTGKDGHRLVSDVITGQESPMFLGGCESGINASEEENYLQDLDDGTPDQVLNRWPDATRHLRRSQSLSSLDKADKVANPRMEKHRDLHDAMLAADQMAVVEDLPTTAQNKIERRYVRTVKPNVVRLPSTTSGGERPSKSRVDSSWGDVDLEQEELDLEAQQAALDSLKRNFLKRKAEKTGQMRNVVTRKPVVARDVSQAPSLRQGQVAHVVKTVDSRPIHQISPDSYIGKTLNNIYCLGTTKQRSRNDPYDSSSGSDWSDSSSDSEPEDSDADRTLPN